jgi:hypothetical protein
MMLAFPMPFCHSVLIELCRYPLQKSFFHGF